MSPSDLGLQALQRFLPSLCSQVGTPFYAYHWPTLEHTALTLLAMASSCLPPERIRFYLAFFALPNLLLLRRLLALDPRLGLSCNTPEEIVALDRSGFDDWRRVVFCGGVLPAQEVGAVAAKGCLVHAASIGNLRLLAASPEAGRIGMRLDLTSTGIHGIRACEWREARLTLARAGKALAGLHAYPGTQIMDCELLVQHAALLIGAAVQLGGVEELDFGGGFPYDYEGASNAICPLDLSAYFLAVRRQLESAHLPPQITLAWEPGRVAFARAGFFVTQVVEVRKVSPLEIDVYVDASFTQIPSPKLVGRRHRTVVLDPKGRIRRDNLCAARLCGSTTLSSDQLLPVRCPLPEPSPGDLIVLLDVGAYGRAGAYNFLGRSLPPEVLLEEDSWRVLRERQRPDHVLQDLVWCSEVEDVCAAARTLSRGDRILPE